MKVKNESGQAMVEFALVTLALLTIISAIVEFGWIYSNVLNANNACREATRYVSIHHKEDNCADIVNDIVENYFSNVGTKGDIKVNDISIKGDGKDLPSVKSGDAVKVNITYSVELVTPFMPAILPKDVLGGFGIASVTEMRLE